MLYYLSWAYRWDKLKFPEENDVSDSMHLFQVDADDLKASPSGRRSKFRASVFAVLKRLQGSSAMAPTASTAKRLNDGDLNVQKDGGDTPDDDVNIFDEKTVVLKPEPEAKPQSEVPTTPALPRESVASMSTPILAKQNEKPVPISSAKVST